MVRYCEAQPGRDGMLFDAPVSWLRTETFSGLVELNEQCLELLAEQATVRAAQSSLMLRQVAELWQKLDAGSRRRAATCPYLLIDAGFTDARRWRPMADGGVSEPEPAPYASFFTVARTAKVARMVFTYAWHLAKTQNTDARLILGMPPHCANLVGSCSFSRIHELAERHPDWLKPRWPARARVWRELLLAAGSGDGVALERARMHGLQMLAAESRAAAAVGHPGEVM